MYNITYGRDVFHSEKCERLHTVYNKIANARVFIINSDFFLNKTNGMEFKQNLLLIISTCKLPVPYTVPLKIYLFQLCHPFSELTVFKLLFRNTRLKHVFVCACSIEN